MAQYIHFTDEQKQRAAEVDLEEFLRQRGEKLLPSGRDKRLDRDHSVTIRGCEWFDHDSRQGGNAISFVRWFYNYSYPEAVKVLLGGEQGTIYPSAAEREKPPQKPFELPEANTNMRRIFAYLMKHRHIDRDVIAYLRTANITTASLWGRMNRAFHATRTNAVPTVLENPSGRMWRAAIPNIVFITLALTESSMCSRHPSICSPSSPCILKIGNRTTMLPAAEHLRSL